MPTLLPLRKFTTPYFCARLIVLDILLDAATEEIVSIQILLKLFLLLTDLLVNGGGIETILKGIGCEDVDWIYLTQDKFLQPILLNMITEPLGSMKCGKCLDYQF
jgi:hypothetical protein